VSVNGLLNMEFDSSRVDRDRKVFVGHVRMKAAVIADMAVRCILEMVTLVYVVGRIPWAAKRVVIDLRFQKKVCLEVSV